MALGCILTALLRPPWQITREDGSYVTSKPDKRSSEDVKFFTILRREICSLMVVKEERK
jgi:hypothetical protein